MKKVAAILAELKFVGAEHSKTRSIGHPCSCNETHVLT
jgi:hypothetical protein